MTVSNGIFPLENIRLCAAGRYQHQFGLAVYGLVFFAVQILLIEQDIVSIIVMRRKRDWRSEYYYLGDHVTFDSIQLTLSVEAIYERVDNDDLIQFEQAKFDTDHQ